MTSLRENLRGAGAMERSRYRIPMWTWWRDTSQIRKNIIASKRSQRNCENSLIVMDCVGATKSKPLKRLIGVQRCVSTGLKAGVNEM